MGTSIDAYMWYGTPAFTLPETEDEFGDEEDSYDKIEDVCGRYGLVYGWVGWEETGFWIAGKGSVTHAYWGSEKVDGDLLAVDTDDWRSALEMAIAELKPIVWDSYPEESITTDDIGWHIGVNAG